MKNIFLMAVLMISAAFSFAQTCTPDENVTRVGITPSIEEGFDSVVIGNYYEQVLQIYPPTDTTFEEGGISIYGEIDYFEIAQISGLPNGFDYSCDPPSCRFLSNEHSCATVYGNGEWWMTGESYPIQVELTISGRADAFGTGTLIPLTRSVVQEGYELNGTGTPNGIESTEIEELFIIGNEIQFYYSNALQKGVMELYSVAGVRIERREVEFGYNQFNLASLPRGVYFLQINNNDLNFSRKFYKE